MKKYYMQSTLLLTYSLNRSVYLLFLSRNFSNSVGSRLVDCVEVSDVIFSQNSSFNWVGGLATVSLLGSPTSIFHIVLSKSLITLVYIMLYSLFSTRSNSPVGTGSSGNGGTSPDSGILGLDFLNRA